MLFAGDLQTDDLDILANTEAILYLPSLTKYWSGAGPLYWPHGPLSFIECSISLPDAATLFSICRYSFDW